MEYTFSNKITALQPSAIREILKATADPAIIPLAAGNPAPDAFPVDEVRSITADILHYCIKGIEVPYIRGQIGEELDDATGWRYVANIVYGALGCRKNE